MTDKTLSSPATGDSIDCIPEYFEKPGVTEALAKAHPTLLIRQMANEILRLRSTPSETAPKMKDALKMLGEISDDGVSFTPSARGELARPSEEEIHDTLMLFRGELEKNMYNSSGSPGHDAMSIALLRLFKNRGAR